MSFRLRQKRAMSQRMAGQDALLVTHPPDVRYLSGFTGSSGVLLLHAGKTTLYTDGRYTAQAKVEAIGTKIVILPKGVLNAACEAAAAAGVMKCGFDAANTTVAALEAMRKAVPGKMRRSFFVPSGPVLSGLREVKDETEIEIMRRAARLGCGLFDRMLGFIRPGLSETEVAAELELAARLLARRRCRLRRSLRVANGLPFHMAERRRPSCQSGGFLTLDFGVVVDGYCSDMTRTLHLGRASQEEFDVYHAVLEAQEAAVAAIAPGVKVGDVDEAARSILRRDKLDQYFTHSTGHGVGLEIHEGPRLATEQKQELKRGMVITVEPGVYIPGKFGVRIEDMVLVTAAGGEVLTPSVKAWTQL